MEQLVLTLPENWAYEHERRIQDGVDSEIEDYTIIPDESSLFSSIRISRFEQTVPADDVADIWASDLLDDWGSRDTPKPELSDFIKKTKIAGFDTYYYVDSYPVIDEARIYFFQDTCWMQSIIIAELKVWDSGRNEAKAIEFLSNAISYKMVLSRESTSAE